VDLDADGVTVDADEASRGDRCEHDGALREVRDVEGAATPAYRAMDPTLRRGSDKNR
jgi:hypothetical protein